MKKYLNYLQEAIENTHDNKPSKLGIVGRKRICIDFDGVIHAYSQGYKDGTIYDPPMKGCKNILEQLSKKYELICFSARINAGNEHGKPEMIRWLKKYDLLKYFKEITDTKVPAILYIDDSAVRHTTWISTTKILKKMGIL